MWTRLAIVLISLGMGTVEAMDMTTASDDVLDFINGMEMIVGMSVSSSESNQTTNSTDDVIVEDFLLDGNLTVINGPDGNATHGLVMTTAASMNPKCKKYKENKLWRLTATTDTVLDFLCVCHGACYTKKMIEEAVIVVNRSTKSFVERTSTSFKILFSMYIIVIPVGTFCNLLVIVGLLGIMKDKSVVNRFVVSLAVADLFLPTFVIPFKLLYLTRIMANMKETWLCKILLYVRQMVQAETIIILTIIAFERYYAICHPLKAKFRCTMKRCHMLILISWVIAFITALPTVINAKYLAELNGGGLCIIFYENRSFLRAHYFYYMVMLLLIPTVLMTFAYSRISYVLWRSTKQAAKLTNQEGKKDKESPTDVKSRIKVIRTMLGLLLVFEICWGPRLIFNILGLYMFDMNVTAKYVTDIFTELLSNSHSLVNPIFFIAFSEPFRKALWKSLPACCRLPLKRAPSGRSSGGSSVQTISSSDGLKDTKGKDPPEHAQKQSNGVPAQRNGAPEKINGAPIRIQA